MQGFRQAENPMSFVILALNKKSIFARGLGSRPENLKFILYKYPFDVYSEELTQLRFYH